MMLLTTAVAAVIRIPVIGSRPPTIVVETVVTDTRLTKKMSTDHFGPQNNHPSTFLLKAAASHSANVVVAQRSGTSSGYSLKLQSYPGTARTAP